MITKARTPKKAVGPKLRVLLNFLFVAFAILTINSIYLGAITFLEWASQSSFQDQTYLFMFLLHLGLGLLIVIPTIVYGWIHIGNTHNRKNKRAIKAGYVLFMSAILLLVTGLLLTRGIPYIEVKNTQLKQVLYWMHVILPFVAIWLFIMHRLAGPKLNWSPMKLTSVATVLILAGMASLHWSSFFPEEKQLNDTNPLFLPALSQTGTGKHYQPHEIDNNQYCKSCHQDAHEGWMNSVHKFSSFNNQSYSFAVENTKSFLRKRDGDHKQARFCATCHDPVLMFSGEFDKNQDFTGTKLGNAGITCTACHAISNIISVKGNGAYTLDIPEPYPFTYSEEPFLQWVNQTLVKAKPDFHKKSFLKPLHKTPEFCSVCHKVSIPEEFNHYKWLRGQNHYDAFGLSGVAGAAVASFYYPPKAKRNCSSCHMPLVESEDFGGITSSIDETPKIHSHYFETANTGVRYLNNLKPDPDNKMMLIDAVKVNMFGLRKEGDINGELIAPLEGNLVEVEAGNKYLVESYVRTLTLGHSFTQGTVDSNQVWVEVSAFKDGELIYQNGGINSEGEVDEFSFFINAYVLDKNGDRIDRRNVEDIFTALYNNNIPPGAAATIHYELNIPQEYEGQIDLKARVLYRKFDTNYYRLFMDEPEKFNDLPIVVMAEDNKSLMISENPQNENLNPVDWGHWNDYGIGLLRAQSYKQAEEAFTKVAEMGRAEGWINLTRVYIQQGLLDKAQHAVNQAAQISDFKYPWQLTYFSGLIDSQNGYLKEAVEKFSRVYKTEFTKAQDADFDFARDFRFVTMYAQTVFQYSKTLRGDEQKDTMNKAIAIFEDVLSKDPEWADAHFGLSQVHTALGHSDLAQKHKAFHQKYKADENARDRVIALARSKSAAADHNAERIAIYHMNPPGEFTDSQDFMTTNNIRGE